MPEHAFVLDVHQIGDLCKHLIPGTDDTSLLEKIQAVIPDLPVRLAKTGDEWYKIGGVVDAEGNRISNDLIEWVEHTFLESGQNLQTLIDYIRDRKLIATRRVGRTLYFAIETGTRAEQFILLEIDKTQEVADHLLLNEEALPDDLEDIIDPLTPAPIESYHFGRSRYQYRRKTDIELFVETIEQHHGAEDPVLRFINDWNRCTASKHVFCRDWLIRPYQHTGRYGEQIVKAEIVNLQTQPMPHLEDMVGKHGDTLRNLLSRFDRQAGYPFAWFFYMVKGKLVSPHSGEAVYHDITGDFAYLPQRDEAVLKDWIASPYKV